ncbi:hypothetical protein [Oceanobacillus locisalsi]|uniref:Uncharacterized protein n=1 Tax=Oceanobacillus locisalsi TaxID=546107 RepID=A0ABW3NL93_9BACI
MKISKRETPIAKGEDAKRFIEKAIDNKAKKLAEAEKNKRCK